MDLAERSLALVTRAAKARVIDGLGFADWEHFYEVLGVSESLPFLHRMVSLPALGRAEWLSRYRRRADLSGSSYGGPVVSAHEYGWYRQGHDPGDRPNFTTWARIPFPALLAPAVFDRLPALGPDGDPWREGRRGVCSYHLSVESATTALMVAWLAAGRPDYLREPE